MISMAILGMGLLTGMQHALEADHVAAVSSMAARGTRVADVVKHGLTWGLGHTLTLFSFAGAAIVMGWGIPDMLAWSLESAVGVMLVGLGAYTLWRLWRDGAAFDRHRHLENHGGDRIARCSGDLHHQNGFRWRSLAVGLMHGMAGSAALLVVTVSTVAEPMQGVAYVVLFGFGSMLGMGALSSVFAVPLVISARLHNWANSFLQAATGLVTIAIGASTIYSSLASASI